MKLTLAFAFLSGLVATGANAQQTWVVDPGGNGNFTTLAAAVAAAGPWDTLLLSTWGHYPAVSINKPLSIVSDSLQRPDIDGVDVLLGSFPGQVVSISGVRIVGQSVFHAPATLEDVQLRTCSSSASLLSMHRCQIGGLSYPFPTNSGAIASLIITNGDARLTECVVVARPHNESNFGGLCQWFPGSVGIQASNCTLTLSDCTISGANGFASFCSTAIYPSQPAMQGSGVLRVTESSFTGGAGTASVPPAPALVWSGTLAYDPSAQFTPPTSLGTVAFFPGTGGQGAAPGGTITCRAESGPNLPAVLVASLGLHGPTTLPQGVVWFDPAAFVVLAIGFTNANGELSAMIPVPVWAPRGLPITVQSGVAPGTNGPLTPGAPVVLHVL